jgi:hypothetical protein
VDINKEYSTSLVIGIDASQNRSGVAKVHLIGILKQDNPSRYVIRKFFIWAYCSLLTSIPEHCWLIKHSPTELKKLKVAW